MEHTCTLGDFTSFLRVTCGFDFDNERHTFGERIKLQKYVFLALKMGMNAVVPLDYSMYIRGPYSSMLADIYFNGKEWHRSLFSTDRFDVARYVRALSDRDTLWLEVASTILFVNGHTLAAYEEPPTRDMAIERVLALKSYDRETVGRIYDDLVHVGLIQAK
ncbi:hypothetical protein EF808_02700 [archaeon]|nr:MAG: hypothetical protein EF808_02700 [archaeon]